MVFNAVRGYFGILLGLTSVVLTARTNLSVPSEVLVSNFSATDLSLSIDYRDTVQFPLELIFGSHINQNESIISYRTELFFKSADGQYVEQNWILVSVDGHKTLTARTNEKQLFSLTITCNNSISSSLFGEYREYCLKSWVVTNSTERVKAPRDSANSCLPVRILVLDMSRMSSQSQDVFYGKNFSLSVSEHTSAISLNQVFKNLLLQSLSYSVVCESVDADNTGGPPQLEYSSNRTWQEITGGYDRLGNVSKMFIGDLLVDFKAGDSLVRIRNNTSPYFLLEGVSLSQPCLEFRFFEILRDSFVVVCEAVDIIEIVFVRKFLVSQNGATSLMITHQRTDYNGSFDSCVLAGLTPVQEQLEEYYFLYCRERRNDATKLRGGTSYYKVFNVTLAPVKIRSTVSLDVSEFLPQVLDKFEIKVQDPTLELSYIYLVSDILLEIETVFLACFLRSPDISTNSVILVGTSNGILVQAWKLDDWETLSNNSKPNPAVETLRSHLCHSSQGVFLLNKTSANRAKIYLFQQPNTSLFYSEIQIPANNSWQTHCLPSAHLFLYSSEITASEEQTDTPIQLRDLTACWAGSPDKAQTRILAREMYKTDQNWNMAYLTTAEKHKDAKLDAPPVLVIQAAEVLQGLAGQRGFTRYLKYFLKPGPVELLLRANSTGEYHCQLGLNPLFKTVNSSKSQPFKVSVIERTNLKYKTLKPSPEVRTHTWDETVTRSINLEEYMEFQGPIFDAQLQPSESIRNADKIRFYPRRKTKYVIQVDEAKYGYSKLIWVHNSLIVALDGPKFDLLTPRTIENPDLPTNFSKSATLNITATSFAPEYGVLYSKVYHRFDFLEHKIYHSGEGSWLFILGITDQVDYFAGAEVNYGTIRQFVMIAVNLQDTSITGAYYSGIPDGPYFAPFLGGKPYMFGNITQIKPGQMDVPIGFLERATKPYDMVDFRLIRFWFWTANRTFTRVPNFSGIDDKIIVRIGTFNPISQFMETYYHEQSGHQRYLFVSLTSEKILAQEIEFRDREAAVPPNFRNISKYVLYYTDFPGKPLTLNCSLPRGVCFVSLDTNSILELSFQLDMTTQMYVLSTNPANWKVHAGPSVQGFRHLWVGHTHLACHTGNSSHAVYLYRLNELAVPHITLAPVYLQDPSISFGFDCDSLDPLKQNESAELIIQMMEGNAAIVTQLIPLTLEVKKLTYTDFKPFSMSNISVSYPQTAELSELKTQEIILTIPLRLSLITRSLMSTNILAQPATHLFLLILLCTLIGLNRVWYKLKMREIVDWGNDETPQDTHKQKETAQVVTKLKGE